MCQRSLVSNWERSHHHIITFLRRGLLGDPIAPYAPLEFLDVFSQLERPVANSRYLLLRCASVYGKTTVVKDMHTRKQQMAKEVLEGGPGSGFIALSGGYGTMEELMETVTWNQLGIHDKGVCVLNVDGFYDGLLAWIKKSVDEEFVRGANSDILVAATDAKGAIEALRNYKVTGDRYPLTWEND